MTTNSGDLVESSPLHLTSVSYYNLSFSILQAGRCLFVLGDSIFRDIYVAKLTSKHFQAPVVIAWGSPVRCIRLILAMQAAPNRNVDLERRARLAFENFYYGISILHCWHVHKVTLITSMRHHQQLWAEKNSFADTCNLNQKQILAKSESSGNQ